MTRMRHNFRLLFLAVLSVLTCAAQAHEALDLDDPSMNSAALITLWIFAVLAGGAFIGFLGLLLGNLGKKKNLVLAGIIGTVLSGGIAASAGFALWKQQSVGLDRIVLQQTRDGWNAHYGSTIDLPNLLIVPVGELTTILAESEIGTRLQVPMLGLDVELPKQQVLNLTFSVPMEGDFLAMDGKLTIRGVSKEKYQQFLKEQP